MQHGSQKLESHYLIVESWINMLLFKHLHISFIFWLVHWMNWRHVLMNWLCIICYSSPWISYVWVSAYIYEYKFYLKIKYILEIALWVGIWVCGCRRPSQKPCWYWSVAYTHMGTNVRLYVNFIKDYAIIVLVRH